MLARRFAPALATLLLATPALAQPAETPPETPPPPAAEPTEPPPAEPAAPPAADVPVTPDSDVALTSENVNSPTVRTATASQAPSMVQPVEPGELPPPTPAARSGIEAFVAGDAAAGRAYISPSAMIGPKGSLVLEVTAPAIPIVSLVQAKFALTDRIEIGAGAFTLVDVFSDCEDCSGSDAESVMMLSAKAQLLRRPTGAIAAQLIVVPEAEDEGSTVWSLIGSKCLDASCRTMGTLHLTLHPFTERGWVEDGGDYERTAIAAIPGVSLVTGRKVKLVVDAALVGDDDDTGMGIYVGIRSAHAGWSGDIGLMAGGSGGEIDALPIPLVSLTGRL